MAFKKWSELPPYEPAKTFYEAVQAAWFSQALLQIESNGHSLSFGRFDQYMDPYYEADLAAGRISEDEATELLANLWIKTLIQNTVCRKYRNPWKTVSGLLFTIIASYPLLHPAPLRQ